MSMATRTDTQSPALHVADSHDLIRVRGARENNPIILRSARGAQRYSPKSSEEEFCELRLYGVLRSSRRLGPTRSGGGIGPPLVLQSGKRGTGKGRDERANGA